MENVVNLTECSDWISLDSDNQRDQHKYLMVKNDDDEADKNKKSSINSLDFYNTSFEYPINFSIINKNLCSRYKLKL